MSAAWVRCLIWERRFLLAANSNVLALTGSYFLSIDKSKNTKQVIKNSIKLHAYKKQSNFLNKKISCPLSSKAWITDSEKLTDKKEDVLQVKPFKKPFDL